MTHRLAVGIDLGTTHCVVAAAPGGDGTPVVAPIGQWLDGGSFGNRDNLPSVTYLPAEGELPDTTPPWGIDGPLVGAWALALGRATPNRLVSSAKSWICHGGVNRRAPILPWEVEDELPHISPFDATVAYLRHLVRSFDYAHPETPLREQHVVVTVPASFDADARELTLDAAREAGIGQAKLLEEPQAAFYAFRDQQPDLDATLGSARLILVVDVGGGTTDLTFLRRDESGTLERIAVGGHLMLGGDNMDAALAHFVRERAGIEDLDASEWSALMQSARAAKETLLAANAPARATVSILRRGRKLFGRTKSVTVSRQEALDLLLDGFVPSTARDETSAEERRSGLTTTGLPYVTDPALPRHVNAFLRRHHIAASTAGGTVVDGLPRPDAVLLNGGVFNAPALAERFLQVIGSWFDGPELLRLPSASFDTAVAVGAARYAQALENKRGVIRGGLARSYFLELDGTDKALCVAPKGMEAGTPVTLKDEPLRVTVGKRVRFPLFADSGTEPFKAGRLHSISEGLRSLPALEAMLPSEKLTGDVPVTLRAVVNDAGALEIALETDTVPPERFALSFALTDEGKAKTPSAKAGKRSAPLPHARTKEAERRLARGLRGNESSVKSLRRDLEELIGTRGSWSSTTCRALGDVLLDASDARSRSAVHEQNWLRLASWTLRPGYGAPGDDKRSMLLGELYGQGMAFPNKTNRPEWWILWRRVAGGLSPEIQEAMFDELKGPLGGPHRPRAAPEMLQALASMTALGASVRAQIGEWVAAEKPLGFVPLARIGSRQSPTGRAESVVERKLAARWLDAMLEADWEADKSAAFAAAFLARPVRDSGIDFDEARRARVVERLKTTQAPAHYIEWVEHGTALSDGDAERLLGDALPVGLSLDAGQ